NSTGVAKELDEALVHHIMDMGLIAQGRECQGVDGLLKWVQQLLVGLLGALPQGFHKPEIIRLRAQFGPLRIQLQYRGGQRQPHWFDLTFTLARNIRPCKGIDTSTGRIVPGRVTMLVSFSMRITTLCVLLSFAALNS